MERKLAYTHYGCKTNQYESNAIAQKFIEAGYKICSQGEEPDIIIVNTCTVTNIADRKSRQLIRKLKEENKNAIVVAVGCYVQTSQDKIDKIKEIDLKIGNSEKKDIVEIVENYLMEKEKVSTIKNINQETEFSEFGEITFSEKTRAIVKIQDGCNNFCTYCLIPYARGRVRSRKRENIINEVTKVAQNGIKEIVITGIHIASYGKDFEDNYKLIDLLKDLNEIEKIERIRLGSIEPLLINEEFVNELSKLEKVCHQFHLSLQSGCDETLKRMNRKYSVDEFRQIAKLLRNYFDDVILTTDIIVGFPGETDREFNQTYDFLKEINFYKMHIFKYSPREGTVAATLPNQIDGNVKEERSRTLINLSDINQINYNKKYLGKTLEVLFEEKKDGYWVGYSKNYIKVKLKTEENIENKILAVKPIDLDGNILLA